MPQARYPHLGVAYLASSLRKRGLVPEVIDMNLGYGPQDVADRVRASLPEVVGVTSYSTGYANAYAVVGALRECGVPVAIGGPHVSVMGAGILKETSADYAVVGEGEEALADLASGVAPERIDGLIWRSGGSICTNPGREFIQNLDSLPFPAFNDFELARYACAYDHRLPIITARGCPFRCIFCFGPVSMGSRFRARSPENVIAEVEQWLDQGWRIFDINDDVFSFDRDRAEGICRLIIERELPIRFNLYVGIRANSVDESFLRLLKEAGCTFISYGSEAGNDDMLRQIRKGIRVADVERAVEMTRRVGINHKVNFIIGHPMETPADARDTLRLARRLRCDFVGMNNMVPYPGTHAYELIVADPDARFLVAPTQYLNDYSPKRFGPLFETARFTAEQRARLSKRAFRLEDRTLARFRFGLIRGYAAYLSRRWGPLDRFTRRIQARFSATWAGSLWRSALIRRSPWQ
jgi:radical SAM superfamily enzyme YgiQ (UPF0313 family)